MRNTKVTRLMTPPSCRNTMLNLAPGLGFLNFQRKWLRVATCSLQQQAELSAAHEVVGTADTQAM
jgi:hypothetical protein